jgi:hypothetical protein
VRCSRAQAEVEPRRSLMLSGARRQTLAAASAAAVWAELGEVEAGAGAAQGQDARTLQRRRDAAAGCSCSGTAAAAAPPSKNS